MAEVVGLVSAVAQLAGLAVGLTKLSYVYVSDVRSAPKSRKLYKREISALAEVLQHLKLSIEQHGTQSVTLSEADIRECLEELSSQHAKLEKNTAQFLWPFQEKEFKRTIEHLHRFRQVFSDCIATATLAKVSSANEKIDTLKRGQEQVALLDWLRQPDGLSKTLPKPTSGTGQWFINHAKFQEWLTDPPSLLWCHGPPGVGKSLIAAIAAQELSKNLSNHDSCLAYYFCDFTSQKQQTDLALLKCLLRQILPRASEDTLSFLTQRKSLLFSDPEAEDLADILAEICRTENKVYLVVDAVDELGAPKRTASLFKRLASAGCRVLLTSRKTHDLSAMLSECRSISLTRSLPEDLSKYIQRRFQESDFADVIADTSPIFEVILKRSDGLFLLAKLLMDELLDLPTVARMRKALDGLPKKLKDAFKSSAERINAQPPALRDIAHRLIGWIVSAERPLSIKEVTHAFAIEPNDVEIDEDNIIMPVTLLRICAGIVEIDEGRKTFGMTHTLAHEFWYNHIAEPVKIHEDIARTSLAYLCLKNMKSGPCKTYDELETRLEQLPFMCYAAQHWGKHASTVGVEKNLQGPILTLLRDADLRGSAFQALTYRNENMNKDVLAAIFEHLPSGQSELHVAAFWGLESIVKNFILSGINLNVADDQSWTSLHWAASKGHVNVVRILANNGANVNCLDERGWSPLIWASFIGSSSATKYLLEKGANHLVADAYGWTALHWAISRRLSEVVHILLDHHKRFMKLDEEVRMRKNFTPTLSANSSDSSMSALELAAACGDGKIFDMLLDHDSTKDREKDWVSSYGLSDGSFDPPTSTNIWRIMNKMERMRGMEIYIDWHDTSYKNIQQWKSNMLHSAIKDEKMSIVQLLTGMGIDVNAGEFLRPALHAAACKQNASFVQILLDNGADVSSRDFYGQTALHQAILNGFEETVKVLIEGHSDVNARTLYNHEERSDSVYYMRGRHDNGLLGIDFRGQGTSSLTPLMLAAGDVGTPGLFSQQQSNIVELLLLHGADVSLKEEDGAGRTCLHFAAATCHPETVQRIIAAGADINALDDSEAAPLHYAAQYGNPAAIHVLLQAGAEINACDSSGRSILHFAALSCNYEVIQDLIKSGADSNAIDNKGRNTIHYLAGSSLAKNLGFKTLKRVFQLLYPIPDPIRLNTEAIIRNNICRPDRNCRHKSGLDNVTPLSKTILDEKWDLFHILREADAEILSPSCYLIRDAVREIQPAALEYCLQRIDMAEVVDCLKKNPAYFLIRENTIPEDLDAMLSITSPLDMDINENKSYFGTKISMAAKISKADGMACVLLKHGSDPYAQDPNLDPFLLAAAYENWGFLHDLIVHSPRPAPEGHWLRTFDVLNPPEGGKPEQFCIALQQSGAIKMHGSFLFATSLAKGNTTLAKLLISNGLNLEEKDTYGWRPLHHAVYRQSPTIVDDLLAAGADPNAQTKLWNRTFYPKPYSHEESTWHGTALHLSALMANVSIANALVDQGADVNASAGTNVHVLFGPRPLDIALGMEKMYMLNVQPLCGSRLEIARLLLGNGADPGTVADRIRTRDLPKFQGFVDVWEQIRSW
ncbi:unnamed protein product [Periconia digitata]|uniref:Uncharacterized protein n=1 Tax=Periconia digitata TaxID=1303443 RepID=A0A9W4XWW3_9PLEO|nr:unnamed protein product [Periconia digitata]